MDINKKLLIISSWAPPMIGGPQNLYNLFSQFPKNSFSIITSFNNINKAILSGVQGSWLPCKYYYYDKEISTDQATKHIPGGKTAKISFRNRINNLASHLPTIFKTLLEFFVIAYNIRLYVKTTKKTVKETDADLLIGFSDEGLALITVWLMHKFYKLPYCLYFFDIYKENVLPKSYKFLAKIFERSIITHSSLLLLTNAGTVEYFHKLYGRKIKTAVIHNSAFPELYRDLNSSYHPSPPYTIIFTGYVSWPQEQSVLNLVGAMDFLADLPVELQLFVPKPTEKLKQAIKNKKNIKLSSASQSEIPKIQTTATLLFLPLSWDTKSPEIIATATPGKFTDYLASGRPMLVHAPDYAYVSRFTKKHKLGLVVDKNDVHLLVDSIRDFLKNPKQGQSYINNALKIFYQNHDARKNAEKLIKLLQMV